MNMERIKQITYFLLRTIPAFLFMLVGAKLLFGWFGGAPVPLASQMGIGGILELLGGAALLLGFYTRPVAFILAGEMAVAYFQFHAPQAFWPVQNQGMPAILFCFIFLFFAAHGGGGWSLDSLIARRRN